MQEELSTKDLSTHGFLGYPILQTADIVLYNADLVPVGSDQLPHIELAREIVRRFTFLYGEGVLQEPQPLLTEAPKLLGPDRRKMSKSYDNCLYLSDSPEEINRKVMEAITDPARIRREDPGNPDVCLIFDYHRLQSSPETVAEVDRSSRAAGIGCVEDKKMMANILNNFLEPIRQKRLKILEDPSQLERIIQAGNRKADTIANQTLERVRKAMKL
jgi:tryptophanyl-tRNA synthetase